MAPTSDAKPPGEVEDGASEPTASAGTTLAPVQKSAGGTLRALPVPTRPIPAAGRTVRYSVEIEDGIAANADEFAASVHSTLGDPRGWQSADGVRFVPVSPQELAAGSSVDIRIALATPDLTARLCAPLNTTSFQVSCWNRGHSVLNLHRWVRGAATFGADLTAYRTYLVNHEVGHGLGHQHQQCPGPDQPAPIMLQQTKSLAGCTAWPWPTKQ